MTSNQNRLWTVEEYHRMIDVGILTTEDKVELLNGYIIQINPQPPIHAAILQQATDHIKTLLTGKAYVRMQLPVTLPTSEPEPDIAIVKIDLQAYRNYHPSASDIFLLIEVAYSSLEVDKIIKVPIYAQANIPEYWILDTNTRQVYIYRQPTTSGYGQKIILPANASITLLAFPEITVNFADLFLP
ncbi:MAG TPA: Uma2 family endonuclease [Nostocaceae cyanobacterium]|nr:Uma2 family endonuclease [Nostocaceae cyanobacterium]